MANRTSNGPIDLSGQVAVVTGGALVDQFRQTSLPGFFAAGNVLHVHDLVDDRYGYGSRGDPAGHRRRRRNGCFEQRSGKTICSFAQVFEKFFSLGLSTGIDNQPAIDRVNPTKGGATANE